VDTFEERKYSLFGVEDLVNLFEGRKARADVTGSSFVRRFVKGLFEIVSHTSPSGYKNIAFKSKSRVWLQVSALFLPKWAKEKGPAFLPELFFCCGD